MDNTSNNNAVPVQTADSNSPFNTPAQVTAKDRGLILTIVIILLILIAMAIIGFLCIKQGPDTIQGQGDATEIRISGKMPGRIADFYVEEGQKVKACDTFVLIH